MANGLKSGPYMLADDTKLLNLRQDRSSSFLQPDPAVLEKWCIQNIMFFHIDKCHYISFHKSAENPELKLAVTD